ncbi:hypothetical protein V8C35DRAFT_329028 [Trichoderma chlorosporum]
MNILWFLFTIFFCFVQNSCAYGERGIAERLVCLFFLTLHDRGLYYFAYVAEGELLKLDASTKLTIAPGCVGKNGGRCNFDELAVYIWAPRGEDVQKPTSMEPATEIDIETLGNSDATSAFNRFIKQIKNARFDTGKGLIGEIDVGKLMPGKSDFYDALSSAGDPVGALAAEVEKRDKTNPPVDKAAQKTRDRQGKVLKWGQATAFYVSALRGKDQDRQRRTFFTKYFEKKFPKENDEEKIKIETMDVEVPGHTKIKDKDTKKRKGQVPVWGPETVQMIDFAKTIEQNEGKLEGFKKKLEEANEAFMAIERRSTNGKLEKFNEAHKKALMAAKMATSATGCTRELPHELKKRNLFAELSSRYPKAAKSRKVKAQKLGFSM